MVATAPMSWRAPTWAAFTSEETEDVDEPPEVQSHGANLQQFSRTTVRRPSEQTSLLTKAIMGSGGDDGRDESHSTTVDLTRRRSMASNVSIASTADLTSDTGLTSPARTNTPSPPLPESVVSRMHDVPLQLKHVPAIGHQSYQDDRETQSDTPRKRSIQFACNAKPAVSQQPSRPSPVEVSKQEAAPRRPCIKFACQGRPASTQNTPPRPTTPRSSSKLRKPESPSTPRRVSALAWSGSTQRAPSTSRKLSNKPVTGRPKYLRANSNDLVNDGSQFHEFARELSREDDWIRHDSATAKCKLTIDDTLTKENNIRRIGREAEEEAELEEDDEDAIVDDDDDNVDDEGDDENDDDEDDEDDEDNDEDEDDEEDENFADALSDLSDGYHTDEETGFAESDESDEGEDGNMVLWTLSKSPTVRPKNAVPLSRRPSVHDQPSDSSTTSTDSRRRSKQQRIKPQQEAPDLPDSTDFVCGTLDEDRPLEEAYLTCMAARRNEKLRVIPQDIDPSFPASDPEDDEDEDIYNPVHHDSDDDDFLPGKMEDLDHEQDRSRRRRKTGHASPRKYHSPPPKRHHSPPPKRHHSPAPKRHHSPAPKRLGSPPPKPRERSPKPRERPHSPRRMKSPAPKPRDFPRIPPQLDNHVKFNLAPGAVLTTKSLPRNGALFGRGKHYHGAKNNQDSDVHLRGAIDIVKGLEKKRQRRREKFHQKYCNRARRGQIPERKPQPGRGAERMKELGLLMAGKKDQGNYVLSV